jgi:hypothetical protein
MVAVTVGDTSIEYLCLGIINLTFFSLKQLVHKAMPGRIPETNLQGTIS